MDMFLLYSQLALTRLKLNKMAQRSLQRGVLWLILHLAPLGRLWPLTGSAGTCDRQKVIQSFPSFFLFLKKIHKNFYGLLPRQILEINPVDSGRLFIYTVYTIYLLRISSSDWHSSPTPRSLWSPTLTTTSSPRWTHGIDSTPTISSSTTTIHMQPMEMQSARRSHGGGTTSLSLASHHHTGCCEMSRRITGQQRSQDTAEGVVMMDGTTSTAGAVVLI